MRKEVYDFIMAVNFLTDNLEFMIEEGKFDEDKLLKRLKVVEKFKKQLQKAINKYYRRVK